jgi:alkylated DNA repair dioxygenase AlkB
VAQPSLFESSDRIVADDERGRITYTPRFINAETAAAWFAGLRTGVSWREMRRHMYDREVDVPRLIGHYRLDSPGDAIPDAILAAAARVTNHLGVPFNAVGLNLYRDGRDSVAPHNDHLYELREGFPIALVSLGATRRMTIRAKTPPRATTHIDLEPGSLFVMDYATQLHYTHGVPKTDEPVGERISLAFRVKPDSPTPGRKKRGMK